MDKVLKKWQNRADQAEMKTNGYLRLIYQLSLNPKRTIPESKVIELLGAESRSTASRQIKELINGTKDFPPVLIKLKNSERKNDYCLNTSGWQSFLDSNLEGKFLLEAYRQVGHLLDSELTDMVFDMEDLDKRDFEKLRRKFLYLVTIKTRKNKKTREVLDNVIKALITEKRMRITYDGGDRIIRPFTLIQHKDDLYLICYREKDGSHLERRTYKLARITNSEVLSLGFPYPKKSEWNPAEEFAHASGLVLGEEKLVQIRVSGFSRKIFKEKEFFNASLINSDQDSETYSCVYTNPIEFLSGIFGYSEDVEILDDEKLREKFCEKAQSALVNNRKAA